MKKVHLALLLLTVSMALFAQSVDTVFSTYRQAIPGTSLSFQMVPIPAGNFVMGSLTGEKDEAPQQTITLSPFWMGAHEVTYEAYDAFMQDEGITQNSKVDAVTRPSQPYIDMTLGMGKSGGFPANSMQAHGALMYCRWLYQKTGVFYRLPTEAEWEYACRAGTTSEYPFGPDSKDLGNYAWYSKNSGGSYQKVGTKQANAWGLYDMLGNVAEWTLDQYKPDYLMKFASTTNPVVPPTGRLPHTVRGGSFKDEAKEVRPANRRPADPVWNRRDPQIPKSQWWNADAPFVGFRIIRPATQPSPEEAETFFSTYLGQ